MSDENHIDVAIVGGGISGVYSAWRLKRDPKYKDKKITVFEGSDRIGGRLLSVRPPGMPNTPCELGGMRFVTPGQPLIETLVKNELKLKTHLQDTTIGMSYLRGERLTADEINAGAVPYNLQGAEVGTSPDNLLARAMNQLVPGVTDLGSNEAAFNEIYNEFKIDGRHLYDLGYWNLLQRTLSNEGYDYITDQTGYYSIMSNWNAGDALRMSIADFSPGVQYHMIDEGYEAVPVGLCQKFKDLDGKVEMNTWLRKFHVDGDTVTATFSHENGSEKTIQVNHLILAMPRRALEIVGEKSSFLQKHQNLLNSVQPIPLLKIFVAYDTPWWENLAITGGRSTTDLPLRQCFYWAVEGRQPGADPQNRNAVLLASYDDMRETMFWAGLRREAEVHPELFASRPNLFAAADGGEHVSRWKDYEAAKIMVDEVQRQLMDLHGLKYAPRPYEACCKDWMEDPYGGGVHFWNIGYNSLDCIERITQPDPKHPVYITGEAYSNPQGWVEGALNTSETMLQKRFGLAPYVTPADPERGQR